MLTPSSALRLLVAALAIFACNCSDVVAQTTSQANDMGAHTHPAVKKSTSLTLHGPDGKTLSLSVADLKARPHKTITVLNEHTKANETYTGVPLTDLLTLAGVPVGKDLHGKAFLLYLLVEGTDHYRVLYSLSEVDAVNHIGDVLVADTLNGTSLTTEGALKLVNTEDKRPARWVRNLTAITVRSADTIPARP